MVNNMTENTYILAKNNKAAHEVTELLSMCYLKAGQTGHYRNPPNGHTVCAPLLRFVPVYVTGPKL